MTFVKPAGTLLALSNPLASLSASFSLDLPEGLYYLSVEGTGCGNPFGYRVDYFTYPAYRTVTFMLELGY